MKSIKLSLLLATLLLVGSTVVSAQKVMRSPVRMMRNWSGKLLKDGKSPALGESMIKKQIKLYSLSVCNNECGKLFCNGLGLCG